MARVYSQDLRCKVIEAMERGLSINKARDLFGLARSTVQRWKRQYMSTGSLAVKERKSPPRKPIIEDLDKFRKFVSENPDRTQAQMAEEWGGIAPRTISSTLKRAGLTYKKNLWIQTKGSQKKK